MKIRSVREHSYLLSNFIAYELQNEADTTHIKDSTVSTDMAADWLQMAAAVNKVDIDLCYHDDSLAYCGTAYHFQNDRSKVVSSLSKQLTIFNFIWNAFEILSKCLSIPRLPKTLKERPSFVDNVQYFISNKFSSKSAVTVEFYEETLEKLTAKINSISMHNFDYALKQNNFTCRSGKGIQIVRAIRNLFAHGAVSMPLPEDHSFDTFVDSEVIELSSRIVLFTIQLMLLGYKFVSYSKTIDLLEGDHPFYEGTSWEYLYILPVVKSD
jgi:hypothetical protein